MVGNVTETAQEAQTVDKQASKLRCVRPWPFRVEDLKRQIAKVGLDLRPVRLQVREQGVTLCALLVSCKKTSHGWNLLHVDTQLGTRWVRAWDTRRCDGIDGRCICSGEGVRADLSGELASPTVSARSATPLGNTGTTMGAGA